MVSMEQFLLTWLVSIPTCEAHLNIADRDCVVRKAKHLKNIEVSLLTRITMYRFLINCNYVHLWFFSEIENSKYLFSQISIHLIENENSPVCVPRWNFVFLHSPSWKCLSWKKSCLLSSLSSPFSKLTSIAPLSFTAPITLGMSVFPVCSWLFRTSVLTIPVISPCKSLRGRNRMRKPYRWMAYWTENS